MLMIAVWSDEKPSPRFDQSAASARLPPKWRCEQGAGARDMPFGIQAPRDRADRVAWTAAPAAAGDEIDHPFHLRVRTAS